MALLQHKDRTVRFQQQVDNAKNYLIPFISQSVSIRPGSRIMEIGCGEGGVLLPFIEMGASCLGVDLHEGRISEANRLMDEYIQDGQVSFLVKNVYDEDFKQEYQQAFDLIILKDTIEHIPDQESFIPYLKQFLKPNGYIFFGFPPWRMPFGGHQQICKSKWLAMLPYIHLLPAFMYKGLLKAFGEPPQIVEELLELKQTGISLARFERIVKAASLTIAQKTLYLFNPIYKYKFGLTPRKQSPLIASIPWFRDFLTTAGWFLVGLDEKINKG